MPAVRRSLDVLLSRALLATARDWEADVGPGGPTLLVWSNLLRVVGHDGVRVADAHREARLSRRAMRSMLTDARWVTVADGRASLTEAGRRGLDAGASAHARIGPADARLTSFVRRLDLELPHHPTPYGPADGSVTGGTPHGRDWRPVPRRADGVAVEDLPRSALLSQALVAFAIDFDAASRAEVGDGGVTATTAAMLALITPEGVPLERLPRTRAWPDWFLHHGLAHLEPDPDRPRRKRLRRTANGDALHAANERRRRLVESAWRQRHGDEVVDAVRTALEPLSAPDDSELVDDVIVVFVGGLGFVVVPPLNPA